jgi:hypothetical protein
MDRRIVGVLLVLASLLFFYEPWIYIGRNMHQSGTHMGGLANGLFYLPIAFAIANWVGNRALAMLFGWSCTLLAGLFILNFEIVGAAYGIWGIFLFSIAFIIVAYRVPKPAVSKTAEAHQDGAPQLCVQADCGDNPSCFLTFCRPAAA